MSVDNAVVIAGSLIGARELIEEFGVDAGHLAREAGLPQRVFDDPEVFIQAGRFADYLELAAVACGREDFGLLHARRLPLGMLGPGWMIMRAAENIEQALLDFVRLYGLYTDAASLRAERVRGALRLHSSFLPVGRFGTRQAVNLTLGAMCNFVRENLPRDWFPQRVDLRLTPDHPGRFVAFFGSGVRFGQEHDALYVDRPTLGRPLGEGTERRAVHEALLRRNTGPGSAVAAQVRSLLSGFVRQDPCNIDLVAAALAVSPRTVQRRLAAAGTSYRELVDEVRADLAWRQVRHSELSVARVAELLGYRSAAAFSRAFRRWHGQSPRAARGPREPAT